MARYARKTIANIPYHIINRGNNHQPLFFRNDDYNFFLESLEIAKEKYPCKIYSFVLMTNHIHLLIESIEDDKNLAYFMKHISQRYGQYINNHYNRSGTLWEGRFKSSPISTDSYLLGCSRYIEMNPVRAGIVKTPEDYFFSSCGAKTGLRRLKMLDYDPIYLALGNTEQERQDGYRRWVCESIIPEGEWEMIRGALQRNWAYGDKRFKEELETILGRRFELKKSGRKPKI